MNARNAEKIEDRLSIELLVETVCEWVREEVYHETEEYEGICITRKVFA